MSGGGLTVTIVHACRREGSGGSPTAVLDDVPGLGDRARAAVPALAGTSHAVFVARRDAGGGGGGGGGQSEAAVSLRFFTSAGELPACGHGTVAALALLARRAGGGEFRARLRTVGRVFAGRAAPAGGTSRAHGAAGAGAETETDGLFTAAFDPGPVELAPYREGELAPVLDALGLGSGPAAAGRPEWACVASVGRPRLLVRVPARAVLAALAPDAGRLRAACDRLGLLGAYVYSAPEPECRAAARMFAPSIGVPEDIANANSTACLAACLARAGTAPGTGAAVTVTVDMGDSLGVPSAVTATARPAPAGPAVDVGGTAAIGRVVCLRP